jgi:hypothetical protein
LHSNIRWLDATEQRLNSATSTVASPAAWRQQSQRPRTDAPRRHSLRHRGRLLLGWTSMVSDPEERP